MDIFLAVGAIRSLNLALSPHPNLPSKSLVIEINPSVPPAVSTQPSMTFQVTTPIPDASSSLNPSTTAPLESHPLTLLRSESLAWDRF